MNPLFNFSSLAIYVAIVVGTILHRRVRLHVRIMKTCFALDVLLLLMVEVFRGAVESVLGLQASKADPVMLGIHIPFAVASLVWWIIQLRTGSKVLGGHRDLLPRHGLHARIFLFLRFGNLLTAFLLY